MKKLSKYEKETIINWNEAEKDVYKRQAFPQSFQGKEVSLQCRMKSTPKSLQS